MTTTVRHLIVAMTLFASTTALAAAVPAPQVSKATQMFRLVKGKLACSLMAGRIRRAHLAPPIEKMLLHTVSRIRTTGALHGTFSSGLGIDGDKKVEAVGPGLRRSIIGDRNPGFYGSAPTRFILGLTQGSKDEKKVKYTAMTRNVTLVDSYGRGKSPLLIEHRDGKVLQTVEIKDYSYHYFEMGQARKLLKQGGLSLTQVVQKVGLTK